MAALIPFNSNTSTALKNEFPDIKSPRDIHFSQASISSTFNDGTSVKALTTRILAGEVELNQIPPIRVIFYQRRWITLDNRRLRAFKDAFLDKIPVLVCDFGDSVIKKEFFSKKTNKSITEGGVFRTLTSTQHFEDGTFVFTKRVLNWSLPQLSEPSSEIKFATPLPKQYGFLAYSASNVSGYFKSFLNLILEESRATLFAGFETAKNSPHNALEFTFVDYKPPKNAQNPAPIYFTKKPEDKVLIKAYDAVLLEYGTNHAKISFIALASYSPDEDVNRVALKAVIDRDDYQLLSEGFVRHKKWKAWQLGSLVTHLRMFDICNAMPQVSWMEELLTGQLKHKTKPATGIPLPPLPNHLNESQKSAIKKFLELEEGIELVQGPPGTGKTTMASALLKLLVPQGRILMCAPSNKAVQVIADRFIKENTDLPVILSGVLDKLPQDNADLQDIFIHTWGEVRLKQITEIKEILWELVPATLFKGSETEIRKNTQAVALKIKKAEECFIALLEKLKKYDFHFLQKEEIEEFIASLNGYNQLVSDKTNLQLILKQAQASAKTNQKEKSSTSSPLDSLFKKTVLHLSRATQILTLLETILQKLNQDDSNTGLEAKLLNQSKVIFSTLSVSGRKSFKDIEKIESLIIDEAGQSVEAESLIPLGTKPKKCLLIGDTKQLPATVISQEAAKLNFERSLMFRLIEECGQKYSMLTTQYRMHTEIRQWPSAQYYGNQLIDAKELSERKALAELPTFLMPYSFINTKGTERSNGYSFENKEEAELLGKITHYLKRHHQINTSTQVGVITFYKGQVNLLQKNLQFNHPAMKIQTVDSFQGDENDIIIISFVRSNEKNRIGFLNDFRRLNVALTRAKHSLIMIGNANTLEKSGTDVNALIKNAKGRNCFFEQDYVEKTLNEILNLTQRMKTFKPKPCHFYNGKPGSCNKGTRCNFSHQNPIHKLNQKMTALSLRANSSRTDNTTPVINNQQLKETLFNTLIAFENYKDTFGIQLCQLIAEYASEPVVYQFPRPNESSKTLIPVNPRSVVGPVANTIKTGIANTKIEQDWKIMLFDAIKTGRFQEVEKLMDTNQITKNIKNPQNEDETILIAATLIKNNELRTKMMTSIKKRLKLKPITRRVLS